MANTLEIGTPRIGNVFDGDEATAQPRGMLQRTPNGVQLSIPWDDGDTSTYKRWFMPDGSWGDDPKKTIYKYQVPNQMAFADAFGTVRLVGCRSAGADGLIFGDMGVGRIRADIAILGGKRADDYSKIHALRSEITGLAEWVGLESIHRGDRVQVENGFYAVDFHVESPSSVPIPGHEGLTFTPWWATEPSPGKLTLHEKLYVETRYDEARAWDDHLQLHSAVRDLVTLSQWMPEHFEDLRCLHEADPIRTMDGIARGDNWMPVITALVDVRAPTRTTRRRRHLIEYGDLKAEGVGKWLDLRKTFTRAVDPIASSSYLEGASIEVLLAQLGIGLEALGYKLLILDGKTSKSANGTDFETRLLRIGEIIKDVVPFNVANWARGTAQAYNGVKHANRTLPDPIEIANCWRESALAFRAWLALELGVYPADLKNRIEHDRQAFAFTVR